MKPTGLFTDLIRLTLLLATTAAGFVPVYNIAQDFLIQKTASDQLIARRAPQAPEGRVK